jgi:uncharacterized protein YukE
MLDDPFPVGDPAGMRALAARLRADAASLDGLSARARGAVASLSFEGPKAERFRDHVVSTHARARALSQQMNDAAAQLYAAAARVEDSIVAWHARRTAAMERGTP